MKRVLKTLCLLLALLLLAGAPAERGSVILTPGDETEGLPLSGFRIGIDPGHQLHADTSKEPIAPGSSSLKAKVAAGTRGVKSGVPEHEVNLQISLILRDILVSLGAEVLMTRETDDVNVSNIERAQMMNDWGADAVIRVHCNGSTNRSYRGAGMYVRKTGTGAGESAALARCLIDALASRTGCKSHGVFKRDSYTGLNWSEVPCVLAEVGYLTNPEEDLLLTDPDYQVLIALGLADGLQAYLCPAR